MGASARRALQSFRSRCSPLGVTARRRPLGIRCSSRVLSPAKYRFIGSAVPLCRWPFPRLCGFPSPGRADHVKRPVHPLFEFRVPPESCPTSPSPPATAGKHLSWAFAPYSARRSGSPLAAGVACARYVPPAGFGYPLGGLLLPSPCRFCFAPAALLGFALRSFLLSEGIRRVSGRKNPHTVSPVGNPVAEGGGPAQRAAVSGLSPFRESLAANAGLVRQPPAAPLGFTLLGSAGGNLVRDFSRTPPARFADARLAANADRRHGVSFGLRLAPSVASGKPDASHRATLLGFSHRHAPEHLSRPPPWLLVYRAPRRALLPTGGHASGGRTCSTGAVQDVPEVPSNCDPHVAKLL
jgi:hypothetical protein